MSEIMPERLWRRASFPVPASKEYPLVFLRLISSYFVLRSTNGVCSPTCLLRLYRLQGFGIFSCNQVNCEGQFDYPVSSDRCLSLEGDFLDLSFRHS